MQTTTHGCRRSNTFLLLPATMQCVSSIHVYTFFLLPATLQCSSSTNAYTNFLLPATMQEMQLDQAVAEAPDMQRCPTPDCAGVVWTPATRTGGSTAEVWRTLVIAYTGTAYTCDCLKVD